MYIPHDARSSPLCLYNTCIAVLVSTPLICDHWVLPSALKPLILTTRANQNIHDPNHVPRFEQRMNIPKLPNLIFPIRTYFQHQIATSLMANNANQSPNPEVDLILPNSRGGRIQTRELGVELHVLSRHFEIRGESQSCASVDSMAFTPSSLRHYRREF